MCNTKVQKSNVYSEPVLAPFSPLGVYHISKISRYDIFQPGPLGWNQLWCHFMKGRTLLAGTIGRPFQIRRWYIRKPSVKIPRKEDANPPAQMVFKRLTEVNNIPPSLGFSDLVSQFASIYKDPNTNLLEDLAHHPNPEMFDYLLKHFPHSFTLRTYVLNCIKKLIIQGKTHSAINALLSFIPEGQNHDFTTGNISDALGNCLVIQTIQFAEPLLAASYFLELTELGIMTVSSETLIKLLSALTIDQGSEYSHHCYTILRLTHYLEVPYSLILPISNYLTNFMSFSNLFHDKLVSNNLLSKLSQNDYVSYRKSIVDTNISHGNVQNALKLWHELNEYPINHTEIPIIQKLINTNILSAGKVLESLPSNILESEHLIDTLLLYYGKTDHVKFRSFIKTLKPPLQRLTLSALFQSLVILKDEEAVEATLNSILKTKNGVSKEEFNAIIEVLLSKEKLDQCLSMIKSSDISVSKLAYITVFEFLLKHNIKNGPFFASLYLGFIKLNKENDITFSVLTKGFISHFSKHVNNRLAFKTYSRIVHESYKPEFESSSKLLNLEQFGLPNAFQKIFLINNDEIQVEIVKEIILQSIVEQDAVVLKWGIDELRFLGFSLKQILGFLNKNDKNKFIQAVLDPKILKGIELDDI